MQHTRQLYIIDIVALALREPGIFNPFAGTTHTLEVGNAIFACDFVLHCAASLAEFNSDAADRIDFTIFW